MERPIRSYLTTAVRHGSPQPAYRFRASATGRRVGPRETDAAENQWNRLLPPTYLVLSTRSVPETRPLCCTALAEAATLGRAAGRSLSGGSGRQVRKST